MSYDQDHLACPCGKHKDCFSVSADGAYHCFSCNDKDIPASYHKDAAEGKTETTMIVDPKSTKPSPRMTQLFNEMNDKGTYATDTDRKLTKETMKAFGVQLTYDATGKIARHYYPYYNEKGDRVGIKVRTNPGIEGNDKKKFESIRNSKEKLREATLFGQKRCRAGGKKLTICEGELDAMAVYQMLYSPKYPEPNVVSLIDGASSIKSNKKKREKTGIEKEEIYKFVNSFDEVIICMDNDEAGRAALEDLLSILNPRKTKIVRLDTGYSDPADYLSAGKVDEFKSRWFSASYYRPKSIISFGEAYVQAQARKSITSLPYPWKALNDLTYGSRQAEMVVWTAQTGRGKTQIFRELMAHFYKTTDVSMAGLFMEEVPASSAEGLISIFVDSPIHLPDAQYDQTEVEEIAYSIDESGRVVYFDDFGSNDISNIMSKIEYFVKVLGCKMIFFDHISMVVSDQRYGDERKALDEIASKLKQSTIDWDYSLHIIAHLNRDGEIRGTAGIEKLANVIINLDRDVKADDPILRNTTKLTCDKNRFSGRTGPAGFLFYSGVTGRLTEVDDPVEPEKDEDNLLE